MAGVILNPGQEGRVLNGHPWIFNTQIREIKGECRPADIVDIHDCRKKFLGRGCINPASVITVRMLTRANEPLNKAFFASRLRQAADFRRQIIPAQTNACRLVFSESDFLPGLILDRYGDCVVMQTLTPGMDERRPLLVEIVKELLWPREIYLRNDVPVRRLEGLPMEKKSSTANFPRNRKYGRTGSAFSRIWKTGRKPVCISISATTGCF